MKLNYEASRVEDYETPSGGVKTGKASAIASEPKGYRRLKFNELVSLGDFVEDEVLGLQPWDGPRGFQAGSFVKPIYRPQRTRSTTPKPAPKAATPKGR